jgi:hypothetical protein
MRNYTADTSRFVKEIPIGWKTSLSNVSISIAEATLWKSLIRTLSPFSAALG